MTWTQLETIDVIAEEYTFSTPVVGKFFRVSHAYSGLPDFYFRGRIAQAQLQFEEVEIYDQRSLSAKSELEIFEFVSPAEFTERRIAVHGPRGDIPPIPWSWQITIEVSDFIEEEGGNGGGTSTGTGLSPWQLKSADYTAAAGDRLLIDTSAGKWKLTLPEAPAFGDTVTIWSTDATFASNLVIDRGLSKFQAKQVPLFLKKPYTQIQFLYHGPELGWIVTPQGLLSEADYFGTVIADTPSRYWRLGELLTTSPALDSSSTGADQNGTYSGNVTPGSPGLIKDDVNLAASFDGSNGMVTFANPILTNGDVSLECWVKLNSLSLKGAFIKLGNSTTGIAIGVGSGTMDSAGNQLTGLAEGISWVGGGGNIGTGIHHIGLVVRASNAWLFYLDGVLKATVTQSRNAPSNVGSIGGYAGTSRYFAGTIDEVAIYNYELPAARWLAHYNAGAGVT